MILRRAAMVLACLAFMVVSLPVGAEAATLTKDSREGAYPPGVVNVTHAPWAPRSGDDVHVTMQLSTDAELPDSVILLYCKVEPVYTCGLPFGMDRSNEGRTWQGTIEWDPRFFSPDTLHVGYNLTMRFGENDTMRRSYVPTGNYWVPATYPSESDGVYFFVTYSPAAKDAPGIGWSVLVALLATIVATARLPRPGRPSGAH